MAVDAVLQVDHAHDGTVVLARLNNGRVNALDVEVIGALERVLDRTGSGQALVLTGREGVFSAGLDLAVLASGDGRADELLAAMGRLLLRILESPRPVVVAADGHGVAAGAMLMLAADFTLVSDRPARYGFAEVANGMPLPRAVVELISARAGPGPALRLAAHGELVGPAEAVRLGLADGMVDPSSLVPSAVGKAAALAALPEGPYETTKRRVTAPLAKAMRAAASD